jgi:hypothetical protein
MASATPLTDRLIDEIIREFPRFRIIRKDLAWTQRAIDRLLRLVTLGAQSSYLSSYHTTLGQRVYVTPDWEELPDECRYVTLRHEREHLRQFRRFTFVGMAVLYLLLPLPLGLAWCRARFEMQGYAETIRASAEVYGVAHVQRPVFREHVVRQFLSGAYGWMWPFRRSVERWYDRVAAEAAQRGRTR